VVGDECPEGLGPLGELLGEPVEDHRTTTALPRTTSGQSAS